MINLRRVLKKIPFVRNLVLWFRIKTKAPDRDITEMRMALVRINHPELSQEIDYILQHLNNPKEWFIPYMKENNINNVASGYDRKLSLPFVLYMDKKLYFPSTYSETVCEDIFKGFLERECILGGKYRTKQPHQYESESCKVEKGDILVDIGCAEGLFTLGNIDKIEKAYLIEGDAKWMPALKATFNNYMDKVVIINKYMSDYDSDKTITLKTIINQEKGNSFFLKMDIEGAEKVVLTCNKDILKTKENIKLAVCTYHRQEDGEYFSNLFDEMGYQQEFSDGFMYIYRSDFNPLYPYFRHGVIRGWK